ncbi:hypothetical protein M408DRAFT_112352 [Serendipita vermifera MAFF 305830]|uniref:Uncharacterized protein n=1 Tax=Serendipita vermifera MAFF 305830 TaxID=933852 RepID=A0A0C2WTA7_SERVB|nr:hypothetical protein M408DRAFT_112352 [Serendipita vermifera MAFF 305830]
MQNIEYQLEEEHQHRARIGPELLHELETSKHQVDFLRDKLSSANDELIEAKLRVQELEHLSTGDNVALSQALKLMEETKKDLESSRESATQRRQDHADELERLLEEATHNTATQISDLQKLNQTLNNTLQTKQNEFAALKLEMDGLTCQMKTLDVLPSELSKAKDLVVEKDRRIAVIETQQEAERKQTQELAEQVRQNKDVKDKLEKSQNRYQLLESGYDDLKATSRSTKEELIAMQARLENAHKDIQKHQKLAGEQSEKAAEERARLEGLLEQNVEALKQAKDDLAGANAEKRRLEAAMINDVEKAGLKSELAERQKQASIEKARLEGSVTSLEKDLQESRAISNELRSTIMAHQTAMDEMRGEMDATSSEKSRVSHELENSKAKTQELSASFTNLKALNEAETELHRQEKAALEILVHNTERNLTVSHEELGKAQLHVQYLGNQVAELTRSVEAKASELHLANERWLNMDKKMDHLTTGLSEAKSSIHDAVELTSTLATTRGTTVDVSALETLNTQVIGLQQKLKDANDRNMALENASRTLLDRHQKHELTEHESTLVKLVANSTMQVHEKERIQGTNDLKRRDATIQGLQRRIKELEKQLASRLEKKSPTGQLMKMADVLNSSPLSAIEEGNVPMEQRIATSTGPSTLGHQSVDRIPKPRSRLQKPVASYHAMTFAKLNQATSEDVEDDDTIQQFLDKGLEEMAGMQDYPPPSRHRPVKRNRDDGIPIAAGPSGDKNVGTRATRRRRLSNGAVVVGTEGDIEMGGGHVLKKNGAGAAEEKVMGGGGEGDELTGTRYKGGQRGKLRR